MRLQYRLTKSDPNKRKFWRFIQSRGKASHKISAAYSASGNVVFGPSEVQEAVLDCWSKVFQADRAPVFSPGETAGDHRLPPDVHPHLTHHLPEQPSN